MPSAKIEWPSPEEMRIFSDQITKIQPAVVNKCLFLDGTPMTVQKFSNSMKQRHHYSGKSKTTCINNILVFAPDGCLVFARMNCPGSQHDARAMGELRDMLLNPEELPGPFGLLADSAFPHVGTFEGKIETPLRADELARIPEGIRGTERQHGRDVSSVRVAAEWGMAGIKNVWQQLKKNLTYDDMLRKDILLAIVHLHNFRVRSTEISQIRTVFL